MLRSRSKTVHCEKTCMHGRIVARHAGSLHCHRFPRCIDEPRRPVEFTLSRQGSDSGSTYPGGTLVARGVGKAVLRRRFWSPAGSYFAGTPHCPRLQIPAPGPAMQAGHLSVSYLPCGYNQVILKAGVRTARARAERIQNARRAAQTRDLCPDEVSHSGVRSEMLHLLHGVRSCTCVFHGYNQLAQQNARARPDPNEKTVVR